MKAQRRWDDRDPITGKVNWKVGIEQMVEAGLAEVGTRTLQFNCFNQTEANYTRELMSQKAPGKKFILTKAV